MFVYAHVNEKNEPTGIHIIRKSQTHYEYLSPKGNWEEVAPLASLMHQIPPKYILSIDQTCLPAMNFHPL